jgi:integrase
MNAPELLTASETAEMLVTHIKTVYNLKRSHSVPFLKIPGVGLRFDKKELISWLDSLRNPYLKESATNSCSVSSSFSKKLDIPLCKYDIKYLKGDSAVSKIKRRWNYGKKGVYVRKFKKGETWCFWYYESKGRIKKVSLRNASCREDAIAAMDAKVREVFECQYGIGKKKILFKDFAAVYLEKYARPKKRSWKTDEKFLKSQLIPFFGTLDIAQITPEHVQDFCLKRRSEGVTLSTINKHIQVLRKMFNLALEFDYEMGKNPVRSFHFSSEVEFRRKRILTVSEEAALIAAAATHLKSIIRLSLLTGMRLKEILNLKIEDVDLDKEQITILAENNKTKKTDVIPLTSSAKSLLGQMIAVNEGKTEYVATYEDFRSGVIRPIRSIQHAFSAACRRAKISNLQFRDMRRTFASRLHESGMDPLMIQRLLRHSCFKISEQVYIQSNMKSLKAALRSFEEKQPLAVDLERKWNSETAKDGQTPLNPFLCAN